MLKAQRSRILSFRKSASFLNSHTLLLCAALLFFLTACTASQQDKTITLTETGLALVERYLDELDKKAIEEPKQQVPTQPEEVEGSGEVVSGPNPSTDEEEVEEPKKNPGDRPSKPDKIETAEGCPDAGRVIQNHDFQCVVGRVSRGAEAVVFDNQRSGGTNSVILRSHTVGTLKAVFPWDVSCNLDKLNVAVTGPRGTKKATRCSWSAWNQVGREKVCAPICDFATTPERVLSEVGADEKSGQGASFSVSGKSFQWCPQWESRGKKTKKNPKPQEWCS